MLEIRKSFFELGLCKKTLLLQRVVRFLCAIKINCFAALNEAFWGRECLFWLLLQKKEGHAKGFCGFSRMWISAVMWSIFYIFIFRVVW